VKIDLLFVLKFFPFSLENTYFNMYHGYMTADKLIKLLRKNGWVLDHTTGGHKHFEKNGKLITIPYHKGDLKIGTLHQILKDAGLK
jgi:predicted RNA binding protein YcfA (HicA-like mRNA interferase family)